METLLDILSQTTPLIAAAIVPVLVAFIRGNVLSRIPPNLLPVLIPSAAGIVAGIGGALGLDLDATTLTNASAEVWEAAVSGILVGSAAVGIHQIKRQLGKPE